MTTRRILGILLVAGLLAGPALAGSYEDSVLEQLQAQGYANIRLSRTLLGRSRIVAVTGDYIREIILDPNTGEILRDLWARIAPPAASSSSNSDGSGSGSDRRTSSAASGSGAGAGSGAAPAVSGPGKPGAVTGAMTEAASAGTGVSIGIGVGLTTLPILIPLIDLD